ncbi:MAG: type V CRISPR-associated protein Cas12b [Thermomonas hydrothermalis]|uniref:type V CRISPR-associated protein Cas12b n=1 Tax=Thermomonas hydrothermalis TaxID=213588 RepID=UPI002355C21D|nr:type V CRISPR-associated protein Cas12b [Thermomonas hydrothermalis]MCL6619767.1 type V CRISPR-associated protein Cas12b [Thermomonas hydrothermalis]
MSEKTTQRAYTLRLNRASGECAVCQNNSCDCWHDALWATHKAVNRGAKAFGDWLLTLRGGLCHTLVEMEVPAKGNNPPQRPTDQERRDRRVLLALSWLSVEDEHGAPKEFIVATGRDSADDRAKKVEEKLREILEKRDFQEHEIDAWLQDCGPSLKAHIREDAVWVNRRALFDAAVERIKTLTWEEAWDFLEPFFGTQYFAGIGDGKDKDDAEGPARQGEKAKDLVQKAGQWLSARFGIGTGADFMSMAEAYEKIAKWASQAQNGDNGKATIEKLACALRPSEPPTLDTVLKCISGPGHKSATREYLKTLDKKSTVTQEDLNQLRKLADEDARNCRKKVGKKGKKPWADEVLKDVENSCELTYLQDNSPARHREFSVMLDHAARRVSMAHSWIKKAEQRRRQFESDAQKLKNLQERAPSAVEWLDRFCESRSMTTGANTGSGYRIRKRAIEGWSYVVQAWAEASCDTEDKRIAAARKVQADPEIEKFGDIQLFEALAADEAICVWRDQEGTQNPSILIDYVTGKTAEHNQRRFKVPAYRHPDELRHPVFCDFGNSRWSIQFAIHKEIRDRDKGAKQDTRQLQNRHGLKMRLWNGRSMTDVNLHWSSKRLTADLALDQNPNPNPTEVTRADRLGRAASSAFDHVKIKNVFNEKEWNGRLQAPRAELDRIAKLEEQGKTEQAEKLRKRLRWYVSFSPCLSPSGPFIVYAGQHNIQPKRSGQYAPHAQANKGRARLAQLILSRLPDLRILSVDLGHRFAAACAVWETLSSDAFRREIQGLNVLAGGSGEGDLFLHVEMTGDDGKRRTVVYRRIGPDQLLDNTPHPAPWARLDRQFLIKLQGEDEGVREASNEELWTVHKLEVEVGRTVPLIDRMVRSGFGKTEKQKERLKKLRELGWISAMPNEPSAETDEKEGEIRSISRSVDELMSSALGTLRLALKRHGNRARIAFAMTADYKPMPGGQKYYFHEAKEASKNDDETKRRDNQIEFLQDALSLWHDLFSSPDWEDNEAKKLWQNHIATLPNYQTPEEISAELKRVERNKKRKENRDKLRTAAKALAENDQLRQHLHDTWKERWESDDQQWKERLRSLKDWIFPRGKAEDNPSIRHVGGLSITRINTISGLYQILKAFKMRPEPDDLRKNIPQKGDDELENFNRRLLEARDRLREQRVKQLASRIIEAALGVGRIKIPKNGKLPKRPRTTVDTPCHAVVIESLKTYRPDDLRTRRENRQLMQWSSAKVRKYLKEGCELYGLHFLEVPANYTSRQCSRTGLPGIRCDDVPTGDFLKAPWWRRAINTAREKNGGDAKDRFLVDLYDHLNNLQSKGEALPATVRVPRQGGNLFIAGAQLDDTNKERRAIQADLNAAANIGLRALLDPDWRGRWWYVPCKDGTSEPALDRIEGSTAFNDVRSLPTGDNSSRRAPREIENLWRDPSGDSLESGTWSPTRAYWDTVQSRVIELLRRHAGLPTS